LICAPWPMPGPTAESVRGCWGWLASPPGQEELISESDERQPALWLPARRPSLLQQPWPLRWVRLSSAGINDQSTFFKSAWGAARSFQTGAALAVVLIFLAEQVTAETACWPWFIERGTATWLAPGAARWVEIHLDRAIGAASQAGRTAAACGCCGCWLLGWWWRSGWAAGGGCGWCWRAGFWPGFALGVGGSWLEQVSPAAAGETQGQAVPASTLSGLEMALSDTPAEPARP